MADWYVRPAGGSYGAEDGTSYAAAWDGFTSIVWGVGGVIAGDNLYIYGTHYERLAVGNSGTSSSPITISFESGSEIWTSASADGSWTLVSGEVYKKTTTTQEYMLWEDGVWMNPEAHYADSEATIAAALDRGDYTVKQTPSTLYARMSDGAAPSTHVMRMTDRGNDGSNGGIDISSRNYVTVLNPKVRGVFWNGGVSGGITLTAGSDVLLDSANITECFFVMRLDGGSNHSILGLHANNIIATGIFIDGAAADLNNLLIRGAIISQVARVGRYNGVNKNFNQDADGIGIGGNGGVINNLIIEDCDISLCGPQYTMQADVPADTSGSINRGSGILLSTSFALDVTNLTIRRNKITSNHRYGIFSGSEIAGTLNIHNNILDANGNYGDLGHSVLSVAGTENVSANHNIFGNTVINTTSRSSILLGTMTNIDTASVVNNVCDNNEKVDNVGAQAWYGDVFLSNTKTANLTINYNAHGDRTGLDDSSLIRDISTDYTSLTAYTSATSQSSNSISGEVYLLADGRLDGDSPCIGAGFEWWTGLGPHGEDGLRFMSPPSMGAYEVRQTSGYARKGAALPARVLPAGVDISKARAA